MKIEVGKEYRTRGGLKAVVLRERPGTWPFVGVIAGLPGFDAGWTASGKQHAGDGEYLLDIVAEWEEPSPDPTPDPLRDLILATFENPESWPATDSERIALLRRLYGIAKGGTQ